ncbi:MAG: hypothetical protein JST00_24870 [Deltaproteobacteria bacterium]|nr:hypothetical protein [Deltaproteobacteria bacterium]
MKQLPKPRSSAMFYTFAIASIGATAVSLFTGGVGAAGRATFEAERSRCETSGQTSTSCAPSAAPHAPVFTMYQRALASLEARTNVPGDSEARRIARAIERAGQIERVGTPVASLAAAKLIEEAGDRLDRRPHLLADDEVNLALASTTFDSALHPFAAERAAAIAKLARLPGAGPVPDVPLTQAAAGVVMQGVDETLGAMERASLAGNVGSCARAIQASSPFVRPLVAGPAACTNADRVVRAGRRLASLRLRAAALASARPPEAAREEM